MTENRLTGMFFYDHYNGTSGRIGEYLGAGFYLENKSHKIGTGRRIFNLADLTRTGRFFETESARDEWNKEKVEEQRICNKVIAKVLGVGYDNPAV